MNDDRASGWFPEFCTASALLGVLIGAQAVVMLIMLAPPNISGLSWGEVGLKTLFTQCIALWSAALLCTCRRWLDRCPVLLGSALAELMVLAVAAGATIAGVWLDRTLRLGVLDQPVSIGWMLIGNLAIVALVTALALRYFYIQSQWRRDLEARALAQIQALQARIRPHFLFNSLNTIASLTRTRPEDAERAIEDLSDLFRATLKAPSQGATLAEELDLCRRYLNIEALRLGDRLQVEWDVDDLPQAQMLPPLLIQPLVENAVHHGIQHLGDGGTLSIRGGRDGDRWWVEVANPVPRRRRRSIPEGTGLALGNIRKRLRHHFGGSAKLVEGENADHVVRLEVPMQREKRS